MIQTQQQRVPFFDASLFVATNDHDRSIAQAILASAYDRTKVARQKIAVDASKIVESSDVGRVSGSEWY